MIKQIYTSGYEVYVDDVRVHPDDVLSAEFEDGLELLDELKVTIRNPKFKYTRQHNKLKGAKIRLEGGWIGQDWGTYFTGRISRADRNYGEDNTITLSALPVDISDGWHTKRTRDLGTYESYGDVVKDITKQHPGFKTQIEGGGFLITEPIQQDETDLQFLKRIAKESGGYEVGIKGNTVIFRKPNPSGPSVINFEYQVNVISLTAKETDQNASQSAKTVSEADDNSIMLETTEKTVEAQRKTADQKAGNVDRAYTADGLPVIIEYLPRASGDEAVKNTIGSTRKAAAEETIVTVTAIGSRKAVAGKCATVKGYGCDDGKYYIRNVKHSFSGDDVYMITCELTNKQAA